MSPSYKPMPNEKLDYQWRPRKLHEKRKEVQEQKKINPTTEEKSKISADLLNKEVKLESKYLPVFDIKRKKGNQKLIVKALKNI